MAAWEEAGKQKADETCANQVVEKVAAAAAAANKFDEEQEEARERAEEKRRVDEEAKNATEDASKREASVEDAHKQKEEEAVQKAARNRNNALEEIRWREKDQEAAAKKAAKKKAAEEDAAARKKEEEAAAAAKNKADAEEGERSRFKALEDKLEEAQKRVEEQAREVERLNSSAKGCVAGGAGEQGHAGQSVASAELDREGIDPLQIMVRSLGGVYEGIICDEWGRVFARVPPKCVITHFADERFDCNPSSPRARPDGAQSKRLSAAVTECTTEMGAAAATGANVMVGGGLSSIVLVGEVVQFGPSGTTFDPPATLRLPFCDGVVAKMRGSGLRVSVGAFRWDADWTAWRELAGAREDGGFMEVESKSFSFYTVGLQVLGCVGVGLLAIASSSHSVSDAGGATPPPPPPPAGFSAIFPKSVRPNQPIRVQVFAYPLEFQPPLEEGDREVKYNYGLPLPIPEELMVELQDSGGLPKSVALRWNGKGGTNTWLEVASGSRSEVHLKANILLLDGKQLGFIPFSVEVCAKAHTSKAERAKAAAPNLEMCELEAPAILVFSARVGTTVEVDREAKMIKKEFRRVEDKVKVKVQAYSGPADFFMELAHAATQNVRVFHFVGHGADTGEGVVWERGAGRRGEGPIEGGNFVGAFRYASTVDCVFLNACFTLQVGLELQRDTRVRYVVCWCGKVSDKTSRKFAKAFYRIAFPTKGPPLYFTGFVEACRLLDEWYTHRRGIRPSPYLVWKDDALDPSDHVLLRECGTPGAATWVRGVPSRWTGDASAGEEARPFPARPAGSAAADGGETSEDDESDSQDEGEARNWFPGNKVGQAEKDALRKLDPSEVRFSMVLNGTEIAEMGSNGVYNGLTTSGFLDGNVLARWGVHSYVAGVWGKAGAAAKHAAQLTDAEKKARLSGVIKQLKEVERQRKLEMEKSRNRAGGPASGAWGAGRVAAADLAAIAQVRELIPDVGEGFAAALLQSTDWNVERAIDLLLENNIPRHLSSMPRDAPLACHPPTQDASGGSGGGGGAGALWPPLG
ncbi:hypothetical protein T484DRAFT_1823152 [Baffinella frigidus]|nr:hypothetical protein T484DRAFT_1823152 [Cryptophyta sp. CCMP2293]